MKKGRRDHVSQREDEGVLMGQATVMAIANKQTRLLYEGAEVLCPMPGAFMSDRNSLVVGDKVDLADVGKGQLRLMRVVPRASTLFRGNRKSPGEEIAIAANIDLLLVVVTARYLCNQAGYIEEAIIAARRAETQVSVFISKNDLEGEETQNALEKKIELYQPLLDSIHVGSSLAPDEALLQAVSGKTVAVVGDRSCGKTSLVQATLAQLGDEGNACEERALSTPASTHASIMLADREDTAFIDTPGFRDFVLCDIAEEERDEVLYEIKEAAELCQFRDCTHAHEDNCGVREALRAGTLLQERYQVYRKLSEGAQRGALYQAGNLRRTTDLSRRSSVMRPDYRSTACKESFICKSCGAPIGPEGAGSQHRNHCPACLASIHVDEKPGDRASLCGGVMEPISVWVRKGGEWAIIHRCRLCGALSSNRVAADDNPALLMSMAVKPLAQTPFPLERISQMMHQ